MKTPRKPSPARSVGTERPIRQKRSTLSVGSDCSNDASRLTTLIEPNRNMESFVVSPLVRRSILSDNTNIDEPKRKSWWKKLGENSRDVIELLEENKIPEPNNIIEELDIEVLSQEKRNYTMDLPESSDSESISSIVIPQRKLFTQTDNIPQKNFAEIIGKRDTLAKHSKPLTDDDKTINVRTRELFQNKQRSKPIFPTALLDISPNKTAADKTEFTTVEPKAQVRNIFGNRATKRKNIFTNFIVAESEDEIPEIEPKVFGFQMKLEARRRGSSSSRGVRDYSPASSITTDIEMDDWKMLPSSTMVENQLEIMMVDGNSSKRARLSKLTEIESEAGSNTTKQSYKSSSSKGHDISRKTKTFTKEKSLELEPSITTRSKSKVSQNEDVVEEMFGHDQEVENKYSKDTDKSRKSKTFTKEKVSEFETSITTRNKSNGSQIDDDLEEVFRQDKEVRNKSSKDTEKSRKSKTFTKEKAPELETSITTRSQSKLSQNEDVIEEMFGLDQEVQNKYPKDSDKSRKSKTFTKEKAPEFETSINTRNKSNVSKINDDFVEVFRIDQEVRNKSTDDTDKSRKSKTFTKEKLLDLETSITTRNKMKISQHGEEMFVENQEVQNESKSKTADMSQSSSKTRSQGNKNSPKSSQIVEDVLNNKLQVTNKSKSKSIATSPKDNSKNMAAEEIPLAAADHENDDELNLTLKYDDENNEDQEIEEVPENIQDTSETSQTMTSKEAKTNNSKVNNKESEVQNESAVEIQNQKKANEIKENLNESEAVQNQETIENGSKNENQSLLPNQSVNENDEIDDINETQVAEDENSEEENESLGEEQNDSELGHSETQEENESQEEQENESGVEKNESLEEQENESEIEQNKTQELNESQEDQQNESEIEQNESEEVETENEEDDGEQSLSQEIVEQDTDQEEVEQDTDIEEQNKNETENQEESEADADSDNENDKDDVATGNDEQVASGQENEENETTNKSHETTGRNIKQNESPELILFNDNNHLDSSAIQGQNTRVRKTEISKSMRIRPSLATVLESTSFSDSTKNSSVERSGWDSHRTTRKTLRQTFGKDFTPRKSLRALVMEKIAKRQTQNNEIASGSAKVPQGDEVSVTEKFPEAKETLVTAKFSESNAASVTTKFHQANETASVTAKFPQANSTELPEMSNRYDDCENDVGNHDSNVEVSPRTRQTSLDLYFKEITKKNADIRLKIEQEVRDSLNAPPKYIFKEPARPAPARRKAAPKPRQFTSTIFMGEYSLPAEVIEDMKYKPPKRFQPRDAPWITKRLYQYLETKLEPKYNYKARVRAEKLVEHIYNFARDVRRRRDVASPDAVAVLKRDMARLDIVKTHFEFYEFFYKFMPRDVRIKVNPDVVNKISLPRSGVFSDIL